MKLFNLKPFDQFIFESFGSNSMADKLTNYLVDVINENIGKLILSGKVNLKNSMTNFKDIRFYDDEITVKIGHLKYGNMDPNFIVDSDSITGLIMNLELVLSDEEIRSKQMSKKNPIIDTINHEFLHVVETYLTRQNENATSKSFDYGKRLDMLQNRYDNCKEWQKISYFIYLSLPHEMRARVSALHQEIKRNNPSDVVDYIKNSKYYMDADFLSNVDIDILLKKLRTDVDYVGVIRDFNSIFLQNDKIDLVDCEKEFIAYIKNIKRKNIKLKNKLIRTSYAFLEKFSWHNPGNPDNVDINYEEYQ